MTTPLERVIDGQAALVELLQAQQAINDSILASISDLYAKVGGSLASGIWRWTDSPTPGVGEFHIDKLSATGRRFAVHSIDADSQALSTLGIGIGDGLCLLDDPASPPVTGFRQYLCVTAPVSHGTWWSFDAARTAIFGTQDFPTPGTRIVLLFG